MSYDEPLNAASSPLETLKNILRLIAVVLGIISIIFGLYYVTKIFGLVYYGLSEPQWFSTAFEEWTNVVGGEKLDLVINDRPYPVARLVAISVIGGALFILTWCALGIMLAGTKIVTWTISDAEAVKKILKQTFGPGFRKQNN
ncbi:hypothetical protein ACFL27_13520 [candidate division CSSED10-310 bacterium]|uniref:DUF1634 domain-containing protein n=1 Tax=candidate division CSSED10-310 bacterium TaxID=2855610 RepID=A0ABV6YYD9_UNCC1